jgi:hypothetical protein
VSTRVCLYTTRVVERFSRGFYWYSRYLRKQLDGKVGDLVQPRDRDLDSRRS